MKHTTDSQIVPQEYIGLDLGDRFSQWFALDTEGGRVDNGRLHTTRASLTKHFGGRPPARIAIEAGGQSAWVAECLRGFGHEVIVANPRRIPVITGSHRKSDAVDAEGLARLARLDPRLLHPVEHRSRQVQQHLGLIRSRDALVRARTMLVNAARGLAKLEGLRLPASITESFAERALAGLPAELQRMLEPLLRQIEQLHHAIADYDRRIAEMAEREYGEAVATLRTVPGVGTLTAVTFVLTLGGRAERFGCSRDVGAFVGLQPARHQSGERDPEMGISKAGNSTLRRLLVQCAHHILGRFGRDSALRDWGLRLAGGSKGGTKRAVVAVARKLAVILHRMWATGRAFVPYPTTI